MKNKTSNSPYACMYLVTKEIYDKLLRCLDEKDKKKVDDLNNQEIGNEQGAFPQLPPPPPPIPPPPPPSPLDFMDDDSNDNQHPPNPPYNYGDDDEWPRIDRPNTPSPPILDGPYHDFSSNNLQDYSDDDEYIDDEIPSNFDHAFGPDSVLRTPLKKGLKGSKKKISKKTMLTKHKSNNSQQTINRPDTNTPIPSTSRQGMADQSPPPTPTPSTSKGVVIKKNSCGLCLKTFQTLRALHNHELSEHTSKIGKIGNMKLSNNLKHKKNVKFNLRNIGNEYDNWRGKQDIKMTSVNDQDVIIPNIAEMSNSDDIAVKICKLCQTTFNTTPNLNRHLKNVHDCNPDYYYTLEQGKKRKLSDVKFKEFLGSPLKKKPTKFLYKCKLCNFTFTEEISLKRHMKNIHDTINQTYMLPQGVKRKRNDYLKCKICSSTFEKKSLYKKHITSHNNKIKTQNENAPISSKKKKTSYDHW